MPLFGKKKYEDENPKKDFEDYRKDYPKDTAREEKKKNPTVLLDSSNPEIQKALKYSQSLQRWKINEKALEDKLAEKIKLLKSQGAKKPELDYHIRKFIEAYLGSAILRSRFIVK